MTTAPGPGPESREAVILRGGTIGWRDLAHRIRRLSLLQLGALVVMGAVVILAVLLIERSVDQEAETRSRQDEFHQVLTDARHRLRVQEAQLWRYRANGGAGVPSEFVLTAPEEIRAIAASDPTGDDPVKQAASGDVIRTMDALAAVVDGYSPSIPPGSREERRIFTRAATLVDAASESFGRWVERDAELRAASTRKEERLANSLDIVLVVLVATFVLASLVLWLLVQRGQRRMLGALDDAAHRLADLAASDALTGLANRGEFHARLVEEVQRARRHGRDLSLVLMDLDHFKEVNDSRGHQAGDDVLVETAARLARLARGGDVVGRVGGEEFGWLLPETSVLEAFQAAERARRAIGGTPFSSAGTLTLSAGVADLADASGAEDLYRLADSALYWAKSHGRDIAFRYSSEVADALGDGPGSRSARAQTLASLRSLARAIDARRPFCRHHSDRVAEVAARLAAGLGWTREAADELREAAQLHDLGQVGASEAGDSREDLRRQILLCVEMARAVLSREQVVWLRHRAERWDGQGLPNRLAGNSIPDGAAILAVAKEWESLTIAAPMEDRRSVDEALEEIRRRGGTAFSPAVIGSLVRCVHEGVLPIDYTGEPSAAEPGSTMMRPPRPSA
jgi:diguanylate cyclase (GGDEF)-like protein